MPGLKIILVLISVITLVCLITTSVYAEDSMQPLRDVNPIARTQGRNDVDAATIRRQARIFQHKHNKNAHCIRVMPLTQPSIQSIPLLNFATDAAVSAYSYNFVNYRAALQRASNYFTPSGWKAFMQGFNKSGNLEKVQNEKMVVSAVPTGAPIILEQGIKAKKYSWKVEIPLLINYQSAKQTQQQKVLVTMLIVRTSPFIGKRGVGVEQFVVKK